MDYEEQIKLFQVIIEQQKAYIQAQDARMAEKDAAITDLRRLVDELQSLKANMEETLNEFHRQFFGIRSEKLPSAQPQVEEPSKEEPKKIEVKSHTRERKAKQNPQQHCRRTVWLPHRAI